MIEYVHLAAKTRFSDAGLSRRVLLVLRITGGLAAGGKTFRASRVVACVVAVLLLTGCSPVIRGLAGIERTGDSYRVVIVTCNGVYFPTARLLDLSRSNDRHELVTVREWPLGIPVDRVSISDEFLSDDFLNLLGSGAYRLAGTDGAFVPQVVAGPKITAETVRTLHDGQVLTVDSKDFDETVVDNAEAMSASTDLPGCDQSKPA